MQNSLASVLEMLRLKSQNEFEKGRYFEKMIKGFLENDDVQRQCYDRVWLFVDWAQEFGRGATDIAKPKGEPGRLQSSPIERTGQSYLFKNRRTP